MVGTVVLGIFPKENNSGDVFLYVLGCQRILRLEVSAVESAVIAAALLHGKNTLIKSSLDDLRSAEVDALLKEASVQIQAGEFVDDDLANDLANLLEHAQPPKIRSEYALYPTYLETLSHLHSELHCVVLSGTGQVNASLVIQKAARETGYGEGREPERRAMDSEPGESRYAAQGEPKSQERFSVNSTLGDALALALYADVPVGIVPALVQRAQPIKVVLASVPDEVRSVVEAIMPTAEQEALLQKKIDAYNAVPLVTMATGNARPATFHKGNGRIEISIRRLGQRVKDRTGDFPITTDGVSDSHQKRLDSDRLGSSNGEAGKRGRKGRSRADSVGSLPSQNAFAGDGEGMDNEFAGKTLARNGKRGIHHGLATGNDDSEEALKELLQRLVPETKVRM